MSLFLRSVLFLSLLCLGTASCKKDVLEPAVTQQVSVPATHDLNAILFVNDSLGYMVGGDKYLATELLTTHDGGKTWSRFFLNQDGAKSAYGLASNGHNAFAIGYDGKWYTRNEAQDDWSVGYTGQFEWMQDVTFTAPNKGFAVSGEGFRGGKLFRTDSLGNCSLIDSFEFQLLDINFATEQVGYVAGYGAMLKTADGGASWQLLDVQGDLFRSVSCVGTEEVWAVGYNGTIVHTADGGEHWKHLRNGDNPLLKKYRLRTVQFKDTHTGYAAGDNGLLLKTTDGGAHWSEFKNFTDKDIKCMTIRPDGSLWLAGEEGAVFHIRE